MGWTGMHFYKNIKTAKDKKEALDKEFGDSVVASSIVNNVYYSAMRRHDGKIFAMVTLISVDNSEYFNLHYKDMDESMHPFYYDCPKYIMKLLDDTEYEEAIDWRKKVIEKHNRKSKPAIKVGDIVKFAEPVKFENGDMLDTFEVVRYMGKIVFDNNGKLYSIPKYKELTVDIISRV